MEAAIATDSMNKLILTQPNTMALKLHTVSIPQIVYSQQAPQVSFNSWVLFFGSSDSYSYVCIESSLKSRDESRLEPIML